MAESLATMVKLVYTLALRANGSNPLRVQVSLVAFDIRLQLISTDYYRDNHNESTIKIKNLDAHKILVMKGIIIR